MSNVVNTNNNNLYGGINFGGGGNLMLDANCNQTNSVIRANLMNNSNSFNATNLIATPVAASSPSMQNFNNQMHYQQQIH